ncbi:hypothetical protein E5676_scaffold178G00120 [Cucumis melo var. makuwa]|uniref:Uncharacterized protein n=1 Tax=Cucumis melo var. makuwa TaxID=1194695 RepID=A0A5D3C0L5_CUCMM|nr:hypothetical protein E6C27_scaffold1290G00500 [Cucumis melo var. makuwa]TYK05513.1 hypothetical protein E5676_scaffold178G00120 [Cucumis melo var. makuwa]
MSLIGALFVHYKKSEVSRCRQASTYTLKSIGKGSLGVHSVVGKKVGCSASKEAFLMRKRKGIKNGLLPMPEMPRIEHFDNRGLRRPIFTSGERYSRRGTREGSPDTLLTTSREGHHSRCPLCIRR